MSCLLICIECSPALTSAVELENMDPENCGRIKGVASGFLCLRTFRQKLTQKMGFDCGHLANTAFRVIFKAINLELFCS